MPVEPDSGHITTPCRLPDDTGGTAPVWAAGRTGRASRAGVLALVTVALATVAHGYACGTVPPWPVLAIGLPLTWRVGWGLSARRISFPRLAGAVLATQAGLHLAFVLSEAGHDMQGMDAGPGPSMTGARLDLLPGGPSMALLHLAAAICLAWWMAVGERLLWRAARGVANVARCAAARLRRRQPLVVPTSDADLCRSVPVRAAVPLLELRHSVIRRGPPAPATA